MNDVAVLHDGDDRRPPELVGEVVVVRKVGHDQVGALAGLDRAPVRREVEGGSRVERRAGERFRGREPVTQRGPGHHLEQALQVVESGGQATTELIHLQDYRIEYCIGCEACLRRVHKVQKEVGFDVIPVPVKEYNCTIKDDMEILHKKDFEVE